MQIFLHFFQNYFAEYKFLHIFDYLVKLIGLSL